jgi:hypothetical protein
MKPTTLANLGLALQNAGRLPEAITACQAAIVFLWQTVDRHSEASALTNLGSTYGR